MKNLLNKLLVTYKERCDRCLCDTIDYVNISKEFKNELKEFIDKKLEETPANKLWYSDNMTINEKDNLDNLTPSKRDINPKTKRGLYLFKPGDVKSRIKFLEDEINKL